MKLEIVNSNETLDVQNVYCVIKNYLDHAKELNSQQPKEPVVFIKSTGCLSKSKSVFNLPHKDSLVHYEGELYVAIDCDCGRINERTAEQVILGYGVGIDYTERQMQKDLKSKGLPWTMSKNFFGSAPLSHIIPKEKCPSITDKTIFLTVNGEICQKGKVSDMTFSIPYLISYLSHHFPLKRGDIIFTGTPSGVGKVQPGDEVRCWIGEDKLVEVISYVQ